MKSYKIREAEASDSEAVSKILRDTWLSTYPSKKFAIYKEDIAAINFKGSIVNTETKHIWVAVTEDLLVVGVCKASKMLTEGWLKALYVLPEYQSHGIGSALLSRALGWFGAIPIFVNVAVYNEKAIAFYLKHKFIKTGRLASSRAAALPTGKTIPEINLLFENTSPQQ